MIDDAWEIFCFVLFCGGNSVYVVVSLVMVMARVVEEKRTRQWEWVPRNRVEYCGDIVRPGYGRLGLFHHSVHKLALGVNFTAVFAGADLYFGIVMIIIAFLQSIFSYL